MKQYIAALVVTSVISLCQAADPSPIVDSASFHWGEATSSTEATESSAKKIKSAFIRNGFEISSPPEGGQFTLPQQKESGKRTVTWYSFNEELKAAVIEDPNYSGYSVFISPANPAKLKTIWNPYQVLLHKVSDEAR